MVDATVPAMTDREFQIWLNNHGAKLVVDGFLGPVTRAAIVTVFTNLKAPGVTATDVATFAARLGCSVAQLRAVATVESSGAGFDKIGRPKILFERHWFSRLTDAAHDVQPWANPVAGGYDVDSWTKLCLAACVDPLAAFAAASWGKFQVMGFHWEALGYFSPLEMAYSTVAGEIGHYEMLARFITMNSLQDEMRKISTNPDDCRPFASAYNGPSYARLGYHTKIAAAMVSG